MNMRFGIDGRGAHLDGLYAGDSAGMLQVIEPLVERLGGGSFTVKSDHDWIGQLKTYAYGPDLDQGHPYDLVSLSFLLAPFSLKPKRSRQKNNLINLPQHETFYATSLATKALPQSAVEAFVDYTFSTGSDLNPQPTPGGSPPDRFWWILIDIHGGANSSVASKPEWSTSYAHRDKLLLFQFYDRVFGTYPSDGFSFLQNYMKTITNNMDESEWGMYVNYADPQLSQDQAMEYYWRQNLGRLRRMKSQVDPRDVFHNPLGIRPEGM
jgi:hypothetical protein